MKVLFIKLGAIGDVVQAAVAVKEFRRKHPDLKLDWVTGQRVSALVEAFGVADRIIAVSDEGFYSKSIKDRTLALLKAIKIVATRTRYDRVITAYADVRYRFIALGVRSGQRNSFHPRRARPSPIHHRNRVHEYWRLLSGGDSDPIDIAAATKALGFNFLNACGSSKVAIPENYIVLAAGGARNLHREDALRRWPIDRFRAVAEHLIASGRQIVLVGGPTDRWVSDAFRGLPVLDLIGQTSLVELVPILQASDVVVANDSGILHLASVTGAGVVALFGPTPANAFISRGRRRTVILEEGNRVSCSPCYDGKNYAICSRPVCLEAISVKRVLEAVELLSALH